MQRRNDIYNKETPHLPRRRHHEPKKVASPDAAPGKGLYGERERRSTISDDLRAPGHGGRIPSQNAGSSRRKSTRASLANRVLLFLLLAVLLGYLGLLGTSMYRSHQQRQAEPPPPVVVDVEQVPVEVPLAPDSPAHLAAADAERVGKKLAEWRGGLNALYRARGEIERGETARALERLEKAIADSPNLIELKLELADLHMEQKRFAAARDLYEGVLAIDPLKEGVRMKWARALHALRHHEAALPVALWLLEDDAFIEEPNQIAAMAYVSMDRTAEAVLHLRRQTAVNRDNMVARNNLAVAYSRLGEYARAVTLFQEVLESDPDNAITYYNLAVSYAQQGLAERAVETLETAVDRFGFAFVSAWFKSRDFDLIRESAVFQALDAPDSARD